MEIFNANRKVNQWWWPLIMGLLMTVFSIYLFFMPLPAFVGISLIFASLIFVSGIIHFVFSISNRRIISGWGWYLLMGVFEILIGLSMFFQPGLAMKTVIIFTGFWLMFRSFMGIGFALEMKKIGFKNWGWNIFWSILTLIFSFIVLINPIIGMVSVVILTALPILFLGVTTILLSFVLKRIII